MNKALLLSFQKNLNKYFLQEFTYDIFTKNQLLAQLFIPLCKNEDFVKFLKEIINKIPINDETLDIRWSIYSIFSSLNEQIKNDMSNELAMNDFLSFNDQAMNIIKKYIDFKGEINNRTAHDLSFYIQLLRDDYPGIFYSILPNLQDIISKIGNDRIYKAIGSNFITFYINPPCDFYNQINEFDEQELPSFFQFHTNFIRTELTVSLENKISTVFFYPSSIKGVENSTNFTLTNSSLCQNKPFIDTIYALFDKLIESQTNPKKVQNLIEPVLDFFPYFIVANQTILLREKNQYLQKLLTICDNISHHSQIIKRFQSDFKFLNFISNQVGKKYGYGDLFIDSFPFLLKTVIQNTSEIVNFSKLNYFSFNDDHRDNDFDFIKCYGILHLILSFIKNYPQNPNQTQLNNTLIKISNLINDISNENTKTKIIIDLFSCTFIEDKAHQFICHPLIAQQLISTLVSFQVPIQIYRANALFENNCSTKADTSIVPWFDNNTSYIYSAIENKDWNLAKNLTAFLPYYIKLYSEAMQADNFANGNDDNVEDNVRINVLLSTKTEKDKLKEYQEKIKLNDFVNTIVDNRLQNAPDPEILCYSDQNKDKYQQISRFSVEFDENLEKSLKKIKNFLQDHFITNTCSKLDRFLNYLYKYYRCAILIDSTTFDSIEDLFKFNFQKAIEGSILHDQMESAEELAKCTNINLFNHIFENLSLFGINSNFIKNLSEKFPLEATAISVSNHIEADLPSKMKPISEYFIFLEKLKSQGNPFTANDLDDNTKNISVDLVFSQNCNDIDDIIFLVDHVETYNQMMNKFDNKTIVTQFYKIFSLVSYVAPESDFYRIKSIETFHQILLVSDKNDPSEIVNDLYQKGENYFSLIIDFILYWISPSDQTSLIFILLNLSIHNDEQKVDLILQSFPEHFDVIMTRYYYYEGFLTHLIKYSPKHKVQFLKTISLLPSQIFNDCNVFDIDSITQAYVRYPIQILKMPKLIGENFSDQHLFSILKGTIHSEFSNKIFLHLYQFFKDKSLVIDYWSDAIDSELKKMTIDSESKEIEITKFFNQLKEPINTINHPKFKQFRSLAHLVELKPFIKYQLIYSFTKLRQPGFFNELFSICGKIDNENIILDISESFGITLDDFYFSRAHLQLVLGNISGSIKTIQQKNLKIDNYSHPRFYDSTYYFLYPFSKIPIFHCNNVNTDNNNNNIEEKDDNRNELPHCNDTFELQDLPEDVFISVNNFLKNISKGIKKKVNFSSPEAKEALYILISNHCSPGPALSLFISFQQLEHAYNLISKIESREEKIDLFINNICLPVVFNNLDTKFMDFIMKVDKNLEKTRFLWDAAIDFFKKKDMPQALIFALQIENKLEDAAIVGFESLKSCSSFIMEVTILGNIIINLKTSINYRKSKIDANESDESSQSSIISQSEAPSQTSSIIINDSKSFDEINEYLNIAELQLSVSKFCIEKSIPFSHEYDLLQTRNGGAESVAAHLFIKKQYELVKDIKNTLKLSKTEILCIASDLISKESPEKIKKFVQGLTKEDKLDLLKALAMTNNRQIFFSVMYDCFDKKEQQYLFLDYNFIVDSFALAYASKNIEIIPLIANRAALLGDTRTVHECEKILSQI